MRSLGTSSRHRSLYFFNSATNMLQPLQRRLHHIKPDEFENTTCPACGQRDETVAHFLLECRCYADSRHRLEQAVGRSSRNLSKLLSNPSMFKHLFEFINETQRFKKTFGDLNLPRTTETELDEPTGQDARRAPTNATRTQGRGGSRGSTRHARNQTTEQRQMADTLRRWLNTAPTTRPTS